MTPMKRLSRMVFWVVLIPAALAAALPFVRDPVVNEWRSFRFRSRFAAISHPSGTERVRYESRFGLLVGNGNHCDYFAGELRTYAGTKESVLS